MLPDKHVKISIIIPVKDQLESLKILLDSICELAPENIKFETIISDDGSKTALAPLCKSCNAVLCRSETSKGPAAARNKAAKFAKGDILLFLDSDVIYPQGLIEKTVELFNADAAIHGISFINTPYKIKDNTVKNFGAAIENYWFTKLFQSKEETVVIHGFATRNAAIRKKTFEEIGGFDISFKTNAIEDYDFGKRLSLKFKCAMVKKPLVYHSFPGSFTRLMRNYFVRASLFVPYFIKNRPPLDKTQTSKSEALIRLTGAACFFSIITGVYLTPLAKTLNLAALGCIIVYIIGVKDFLRSTKTLSNNIQFPMSCFAIHYTSSLVITAGSAYGLFSYLLEKNRFIPKVIRYVDALNCLSKALLQKKVRYMIFFVTSRCNAKCAMCFNWDSMEKRKNEPQISFDNIEKLAKSIKVLPQLTLSGGEPLLRSDISDILKTFYDNSYTRFFTVPSNALMPDRIDKCITRFVKDCPKGFLNLCLPFHGEEKLFNAILGVPGSYQKLRATYLCIQKKKKEVDNISCTLNFVMSKYNHSSYKSIIDLAIQEFPDAVFCIALARGVTHERDAVDFPIGSYLAAHEYLSLKRKNKNKYNPYEIIHSAISEQMSFIVSRAALKNIKSLKCRAGQNIAVITDNGQVYPCEMLDLIKISSSSSTPEITSLGDLSEYNYDFYALYNSDKAKKLINWIKTHDCVCTWECAVYNSIVNSVDGVCTLGKKCFKYLTARSTGKIL